MSKLLKQILKFGVVGGIAFILDYSILFFLTEFMNVHYFMSACISFVISVTFNYLVSVLWVFNTCKNKSKLIQFFIFMILSIIGLAINQLIMLTGVEIFALYYMNVKIIATILVMIFNFITRKKFLE